MTEGKYEPKQLSQRLTSLSQRWSHGGWDGGSRLRVLPRVHVRVPRGPPSLPRRLLLPARDVRLPARGAELRRVPAGHEGRARGVRPARPVRGHHRAAGGDGPAGRVRAPDEQVQRTVDSPRASLVRKREVRLRHQGSFNTEKRPPASFFSEVFFPSQRTRPDPRP